MLWNFWIDVGGTFTDCVATDRDGREYFKKVLSSGLIKGRLDLSKSKNEDFENQEIHFFDPHRLECNQFWQGAWLRLVDAAGSVTWEAEVVSFDQPRQDEIIGGWFRFAGLTPTQRQQLLQIVKAAKALPDSSQVAYELDARLPAPILGIHLIQDVPIRETLKPCQVDLGTTRGTNALLTRTGAATALVTSYGFRDFLRIGDQARTKLFALTVVKPEPLFHTSIEIRERVLADGSVLQSLDVHAVENQLSQLKQDGIQSLAICLMFGFRFPDHERRVAEIARRVGFRSICCSSDVAPVIKIVPRGETTVLDAYLNPVIAEYLNEVHSFLPAGSQLRLMTSSGGLVSQSRFSGKDSVLSGPAGGVVGACRVGQQLGFDSIIGFDMGGTSTDVSRFDGQFTRTYETFKAGVRIVTPMLEVETVAAGGGSICWFDGTKLRVGPQSAGANPGPACYGRGGPLAITDINLFLGRMESRQFPFALDLPALVRRLDEVMGELHQAGFAMSQEELAQGFLRIANHNMAAAIETVSVKKGFDPRNDLLVSFGGAGSQHCCEVADHLGMKRILDHPQSSVLSAVGIRLAEQSAHAVESINWSLTEDTMPQLESQLNEEVAPKLVQNALQQLLADGNAPKTLVAEFSVDLRYRGTENFLSVKFDRLQLQKPSSSVTKEKCSGSLAEVCKQFSQIHYQQFGYLQNRPLELVAMRVELRVVGTALPKIKGAGRSRILSPSSRRMIYSRGRRQNAGLFQRHALISGDCIVGPALVTDAVSTVIIDDGWKANVYETGILLIERSDDWSRAIEMDGEQAASASQPDPIQLEIFNNSFTSIAAQMGVALQKTSVSVNVKERLDFSCAIFSATGDLVVNAPHIPVHLGAMSETVRSIIAQNPKVCRGDVFVTNDPYAGGSHLPDVTVVTPVFSPTEPKLWFWVASRSHHAEIGGIAPGSMPANATRLGEEGVLIQNLRLIVGGQNSANAIERFDELKRLLTSSRYPSRNPDENIADVKAQVAANQTGVEQLLRLVDHYSYQTVSAYMIHIQNAAQQKVCDGLSRIIDGEYSFDDFLDNGAAIRVKLTKSGGRLRIEFSGTDPVLSDNLNANRAIVSSAVMYVLRLLIDEEIPLNEGVLKPVELIVPECFLNPKPAMDPFDSPAIVGGNVETSQRIVDCLLGALGLAAASQGTMNNWLMGNESFGYYETLGGGSGATADGPGADAVHCHMTNTRLTDPEILETRYPVVLHEFSIRRGSGGSGVHRGGDGMIRDLEFRQPMTVSLLTSRRNSNPFGLAGGSSGACGINQLINAKGRTPLPSRCQMEVERGDRLRLETPGGGGWGEQK